MNGQARKGKFLVAGEVVDDLGVVVEHHSAVGNHSSHWGDGSLWHESAGELHGPHAETWRPGRSSW